MFIPLRSGAVFFASGKVVHGFGRGSKQLGIPTANLDEVVVQQIPDSIVNGIYFGWAKLKSPTIYKTVLSIGFNPYFKNTKRTLEAHILHNFYDNFYGDTIQLLAVKYHRPECDFKSLDDLIDKIHSDIDSANLFLNQPEALYWCKSNLFHSTTTISNSLVDEN